MVILIVNCLLINGHVIRRDLNYIQLEYGVPSSLVSTGVERQETSVPENLSVNEDLVKSSPQPGLLLINGLPNLPSVSKIPEKELPSNSNDINIPPLLHKGHSENDLKLSTTLDNLPNRLPNIPFNPIVVHESSPVLNAPDLSVEKEEPPVVKQNNILPNGLPELPPVPKLIPIPTVQAPEYEEPVEQNPTFEVIRDVFTTPNFEVTNNKTASTSSISDPQPQKIELNNVLPSTLPELPLGPLIKSNIPNKDHIQIPHTVYGPPGEVIKIVERPITTSTPSVYINQPQNVEPHQVLLKGLPELPPTPIIKQGLTETPVTKSNIPKEVPVHTPPKEVIKVEEPHRDLLKGLPEPPSKQIITQELPTTPIIKSDIPNEVPIHIPHTVYGPPVEVIKNEEPHKDLLKGLPELPPTPIITLPAVPVIKSDIPQIPNTIYAQKAGTHKGLPLSPIVINQMPTGPILIPQTNLGLYPVLLTQSSKSDAIVKDLPNIGTTEQTVKENNDGIEKYKNQIQQMIGNKLNNTLQTSANLHKDIEKKGSQISSKFSQVSESIPKQIENHHQHVVQQLKSKHQEIVNLFKSMSMSKPTVVTEPIISASPNVVVVPISQPEIYTPHTVYGVPMNTYFKI